MSNLETPSECPREDLGDYVDERIFDTLESGYIHFAAMCRMSLLHFLFRLQTKKVENSSFLCFLLQPSYKSIPPLLTGTCFAYIVAPSDLISLNLYRTSVSAAEVTQELS